MNRLWKILWAAAFVAAGMAVFFYFPKPQKILPIPVDTNSHYSYFSQKEFYEEAYKAAKPNRNNISSGEIKGIIVNHHLLASSFIAEAFNTVATTAPITVLLISPNHFDAGRADVITSAKNWQTPYGVLEADTEQVNLLTASGLASVEESPFEQEHGVSGIVGFIKKSLPNSKVVPLIFKNRIKLPQIQSLVNSYVQPAEKNVLVVGSFDFSHYLTSRGADFHDIENLSTVESFNFGSIYNLDIDSRPGLAFFLQLLQNSGNQNFHLLENSNSSKLAKQDVLETTSYITGYFTKGKPVTNPADTALILPPIVSSRNAGESLNRNNKAWSVEYLERLFYGQDKTITYVEGNKSLVEPLLKKYSFTDLVSKDQKVAVGNYEIQILLKPNQATLQKAIDQGADAVVQYKASADSVSFYKGKPVVSISRDFLSDDTLKSGGTGLAYGLAWQNNRVSITILPIGINGGRAKLLIGNDGVKILEELALKSSVYEEIKKQIGQGIIKINNN